MWSKSWASRVKLKCFNLYSSCSKPNCYGQSDLSSEFLLDLNLHWNLQSWRVPHTPVLDLKNQRLRWPVRKTVPDHCHQGTGRRALSRGRKLPDGCLTTGAKGRCFHAHRERDLREASMARSGKRGPPGTPRPTAGPQTRPGRNLSVQMCPAVSRFGAGVPKTTLSLWIVNLSCFTSKPGNGLVTDLKRRHASPFSSCQEGGLIPGGSQARHPSEHKNLNPERGCHCTVPSRQAVNHEQEPRDRK